MIDFLVIHSTGTESKYVPEKKDYILSVPCDVIHFNGQLSRYKADTEHPTNNDSYKHIAYIGGRLDGKVADTATWKQYDSLEVIVMYNLLYNQHIKIGPSSLFFDTNEGINIRRWLLDIGVNKKNIM
tara:strand:- start:4844 stop:5224 length:381 start_codon:yes stop_codon:yes gene_type:complete